MLKKEVGVQMNFVGFGNRIRCWFFPINLLINFSSTQKESRENWIIECLRKDFATEIECE